jgi:hypothetical protein
MHNTLDSEASKARPLDYFEIMIKFMVRFMIKLMIKLMIKHVLAFVQASAQSSPFSCPSDTRQNRVRAATRLGPACSIPRALRGIFV